MSLKNRLAKQTYLSPKRNLVAIIIAVIANMLTFLFSQYVAQECAMYICNV